MNTVQCHRLPRQSNGFVGLPISRLFSVICTILIVALCITSSSSILGVNAQQLHDGTLQENPTTVTTQQQQKLDGSRPVVLMASSTAKQGEIVQWIYDRQGYLQDQPLIVQKDVQTALLFHPFINVNELNIIGLTQDNVAPNIQQDLGTLSSTSLVVDEIMVASMILQDQVGGVVYLRDVTSDLPFSPVSSSVVDNACVVANKPIASNIVSAEWILRGVMDSLRHRRKAFLLFNPVAGHGNPQDDLTKIRNTLDSQLDLTIIYTQRDRDVAEQATEIINMIQASADYADRDSTNNSNAPILIASGGDGTVSAVAGVTMGSDVPFAVIPRGTANAFSVALGIPTGVEDACKNILRGHIRTVDGAYMNDIPMILLAGLGFEAGMVDAANRELKDQIGALAYIYGGAKTLFDQEPFHCDITIDGQPYPNTMKMTGITVANVAPPTSVSAQGMGKVIPDDGLLEVSIQVALNEFSSLANMASLLGSAVTQEPTQTDSLLALRAKEIDVSCPESHKVVVDGEMFETDRMLFKIVSNGLNVVAPSPI